LQSVSVGIEEVGPKDWTEQIYKPDIIGKPDTIYKQPGYWCSRSHRHRFFDRLIFVPFNLLPKSSQSRKRGSGSTGTKLALRSQTFLISRSRWNGLIPL